jgi:hypothetical protein
MANDRMNDDLDRKMGRTGQGDDLDQGSGKQTTGRNPNDQQTGQKGAGQNKPSDDLEQNDYSTGGGQGGRQGGQNR